MVTYFRRKTWCYKNQQIQQVIPVSISEQDLSVIFLALYLSPTTRPTSTDRHVAMLLYIKRWRYRSPMTELYWISSYFLEDRNLIFQNAVDVLFNEFGEALLLVVGQFKGHLPRRTDPHQTQYQDDDGDQRARWVKGPPTCPVNQRHRFRLELCQNCE